MTENRITAMVHRGKKVREVGSGLVTHFMPRQLRLPFEN